MKIILSRKGFDSVAGGCASPIFEDGSLLSLPIPQLSHWPPIHQRVYYADLYHSNYLMGMLVKQLTRERIGPDQVVHLDPDLRADSLRRKPGWRPLFGQSLAAQSHLAQHQVGVGDLFLFFGWFREVEQRGWFHFKRDAPDRHILFGWLEAGEVWPLGHKRTGIPEWADMHPHVTADFEPSNTIYVAADKPKSAGVFRKVRDELVLSQPGANRSSWRLPKWFHPAGKQSCLSYHSSPTRWKLDDDYAYLTSVGRGQEFVLDADHYPEAENWARRLIADNS